MSFLIGSKTNENPAQAPGQGNSGTDRSDHGRCNQIRRVGADDCSVNFLSTVDGDPSAAADTEVYGVDSGTTSFVNVTYTQCVQGRSIPREWRVNLDCLRSIRVTDSPCCHILMCIQYTIHTVFHYPIVLHLVSCIAH